MFCNLVCRIFKNRVDEHVAENHDIKRVDENIENECVSNFKPTEIESMSDAERQMIKNLSKYSKSTAPKLFTMNGTEIWCKIIDVYDGDTVDILFYMQSELRHNKMRLYGIDTPELKPLKSISNREDIIQKAHSAKSYLQSIVLDKIVYVRFVNEEKYGRLMGHIYLSKEQQKISVNQMLVDSGHAVQYFGGKK